MSRVFDKSERISQNFDDLNRDLETNATENVNKTNQNHLSLFSKIVFAIAGAPYQMFFSAISVFSTVFLLEVANIPPSKTSVILFVSRAVDAITDPIYGSLIDKTSPKKFGKLKFWIICSMPLSIISYLMLWYVPDFSENGKFVWFLLWNSLFFAVLTGIRLPYVSLLRNITRSKRERDNLTTMRMGCEMIGILAALGIQSPFVSTKGGCLHLNESEILNDTLNLNLMTDYYADTTETPIDIPTTWDKNKYVLIASILAAIFLVTHVLLLFFVKENHDTCDDQQSNSKNINTYKELKQMITFKPFLVLCIGTFLNTFGLQVLQNNLQLYFEYGYTAIRTLFTYTILGILGVSILAVPLWQFLMGKMGKKRAMMIGCSTILPLTISLLFYKTNSTGEIISVFALSILGANAFTVTLLISWAMLPECVDAYFLKYRSKSDALFGSFFVIGPKILMAIYLGISQAILSAAGYRTGVCAEDQSENVGKAVTYLISFVPFFIVLISIITIYFYPINEEIAKANSEQIKKLKSSPSKTFEIDHVNFDKRIQSVDLNVYHKNNDFKY